MKKTQFSVFITLIFILAACAKEIPRQEMPTENNNPTSIVNKGSIENGEQPSTLDAAAQNIVATLSEKDRVSIQKMPFDKLSTLHHTLGRYIRNKYELFGSNDQLRLSACEARKDYRKKHGLSVSPSCHPDDASAAIIETVWRKLNGLTE